MFWFRAILLKMSQEGTVDFFKTLCLPLPALSFRREIGLDPSGEALLQKS